MKAPEKKVKEAPLPDYIKEQAKTKVKKRRLKSMPGGKRNASASSKKDKSLSSLPKDPDIFSLKSDDGELLRAPSETPWKVNSFKVVNGSFVDHGPEDSEESKGPSPEEIQAIIEKIRLEHKTRRG